MLPTCLMHVTSVNHPAPETQVHCRLFLLLPCLQRNQVHANT